MANNNYFLYQTTTQYKKNYKQTCLWMDLSAGSEFPNKKGTSNDSSGTTTKIMKFWSNDIKKIVASNNEFCSIGNTTTHLVLDKYADTLTGESPYTKRTLCSCSSGTNALQGWNKCTIRGSNGPCCGEPNCVIRGDGACFPYFEKQIGIGYRIIAGNLVPFKTSKTRTKNGSIGLTKADEYESKAIVGKYWDNSAWPFIFTKNNTSTSNIQASINLEIKIHTKAVNLIEKYKQYFENRYRDAFVGSLFNIIGSNYKVDQEFNLSLINLYKANQDNLGPLGASGWNISSNGMSKIVGAKQMYLSHSNGNYTLNYIDNFDLIAGQDVTIQPPYFDFISAYGKISV